MQQLLLPTKRAKLLTSDKTLLKATIKRLNCKIKVENENQVEIDGEAYDEYNAKNIIGAFGRGFDMETAMKLLSEDCFFSIVNFKEMLKGKEQIARIKARIIGENGRAKTYIEEVSGVDMCVYGNTVSFIGTIDNIKIASAAVEVLLNGGTHKKAYRNMEATKRKLNQKSIRGIL